MFDISSSFNGPNPINKYDLLIIASSIAVLLSVDILQSTYGSIFSVYSIIILFDGALTCLSY